jgi:OmpA-OmpF porin, OOP family
LKEQEKVVSLEDVKNGEPKNVLPISQEKAKEINQIFELATKTVSFKSNSTELQLRSLEPLDQVFDLLLDNPGLRISLSGYTDNTGDDESNLTLSKQRAERVKAYLVNKGIAADRIIADGYGNTNPISNNNYDWGRALNRRVEIEIIEE